MFNGKLLVYQRVYHEGVEMDVIQWPNGFLSLMFVDFMVTIVYVFFHGLMLFFLLDFMVYMNGIFFIRRRPVASGGVPRRRSWFITRITRVRETYQTSQRL